MLFGHRSEKSESSPPFDRVTGGGDSPTPLAPLSNVDFAGKPQPFGAFELLGIRRSDRSVTMLELLA